MKRSKNAHDLLIKRRKYIVKLDMNVNLQNFPIKCGLIMFYLTTMFCMTDVYNSYTNKVNNVCYFYGEDNN
jgi:hypothetical protein